MAIFDTIKNAAKGYVEDHLGAPQPAQNEPAQEPAPETAAQNNARSAKPVAPSERRPLWDFRGVGDRLSFPHKDQQFLRDPAQEVLSLANAQSKAAMQETQSNINAQNCGPEQVMDLATGAVTDNVSMAQTPADLGLSTATSNTPTVPLNPMPTGKDPKDVEQQLQQFQRANSMQTPMAPGSASGDVFARFRKGGAGTTPDLSYAEDARERADRHVDMQEEIVKRWAMARSGRDYVKGMPIEDIPAAAMILAMKEVPTPSYVTEARQYYQTVVTQYGHDVSVLRELAKQDENLRAAINTQVAYANERYQSASAAKDLGISLGTYTKGEKVVFFDQNGARSISHASKDTAEQMQKNVELITKSMEEYDKRVAAGEDVSKLTGSVVRTWNSAVSSGSIDANTGYSRILGYLSHENTWTLEDKVLASKLESRGYNWQSIVTAIAINHEPSLRQKMMEMVALNKQAAATGVGKMSGGALNTIYSSADADTMVNAMQEIELQRTKEAFTRMALQRDGDRALDAVASKEEIIEKLVDKNDPEMYSALRDYALAENAEVKLGARARVKDMMVKSPKLDVKLSGEVLTGAFGETNVNDRMQFLRDNDAPRRAAGDNQSLVMSLEAGIHKFRSITGLHEATEARDKVRQIVAAHKGKSTSELIKSFQQAKIREGLTEAEWKTAVTLAERVSPRASTAFADEVLRNIDAAGYSLAMQSPYTFTVSQDAFQKMNTMASNYGVTISKKEYKEMSDGTYSVTMSPQKAALYSAMEQVTPGINQLIAMGKKPTLGQLKEMLAVNNPKQLAAYEVLCGSLMETTLERYANNLWRKYVSEQEGLARAQRLMAMQTPITTGGGNGR